VSSPLILGRVNREAQLVLTRSERARYDERLVELIDEDVELAIRKRRSQRSYDQLRYWFGVPMKRLSERTGYTKMQQHYLCLAICFGVILDPVTGHEVPIVPASKHLTQGQFAELIEWCPPWAMETHQVQIPLPGEVDVEDLPGASEDVE
jgi:hypothetical protein